MPNRIELPEELQSLIEKREGDRRQPVDQDGMPKAQQLPTGEERRRGDRRKNSDENSDSANDR